MQIKGTAVKSIKDFVDKKFKERSKEWFNSLPETTQEILKSGVFANNWYPMKDAAITPTKAIAKMFFNNDVKEAAFQSGRYSAEIGLKGVYKIFIMIAKPGYIIQRASRVFQSYYSPTDMEVAETKIKAVTLHITKFPEPDHVIEYRIAGWIQKALELTQCNDVKVNITKSLTKGDSVTEFDITWN